MKSAREQSQTIQRIKVGMIGLVAVVLLIAMASAIISSATRPAVLANGQSDVVANLAIANAAGTGGEPLAELGAAPSVVNEQIAPAP